MQIDSFEKLQEIQDRSGDTRLLPIIEFYVFFSKRFYLTVYVYLLRFSQVTD